LNPLHYSVWDILQQLVCEGRHEPFAYSKIQNVISDKWHDVVVREPESEKQYSRGKSV